jgi:two-component system NarL family sensor kinase
MRHALDESSRLLRSTVTELHPAVLDRVGLPAALDDLVRNAAAAGHRTAQLDVNGWPQQRASADTLLFSAARELLSNVVKHSHATSVDVAPRTCPAVEPV